VGSRPTHLSDGTEIEIISAGYAHGKDDRTMQDRRLEVRRGAERVTLSLERDDAPAPQVALGWRPRSVSCRSSPPPEPGGAAREARRFFVTHSSPEPT
jgi:hypothetical protein